MWSMFLELSRVLRHDLFSNSGKRFFYLAFYACRQVAELKEDKEEASSVWTCGSAEALNSNHCAEEPTEMFGQLNLLPGAQEVMGAIEGGLQDLVLLIVDPELLILDGFGVQPLNVPLNGPNVGVLGPNPVFGVPGAPAVGLGRGNPQQVLARGDDWIMTYEYRRRSRMTPSASNSQVGRNVRTPDWKRLCLPPFRRDVYREHFRTAQRPIEEVEAYRKANNITVTGRDVPKPIFHIDEAGFPEHLIKVIEAHNHGSTPSPAQAQCWPVALGGKDLVAVVNDESEGMYLAFLIPPIVHMLNQLALFRGCAPAVVFLMPTREAAQQMRVAVDDVAAASRIRTAYLLPGEPREPQLSQLRQGVDVCIATPGRLVSFMEERKIDLRRCTYLVLGEADRMLTMGLGPQLRTIAENLRPDRQVLVWLSSRTMDVSRLIDELTSDYITVSVGATAHQGTSCRDHHIVYVCETAEKEQKLMDLFNDILCEKGDKAIVFVERRETVQSLVSALHLREWPAVGMHGKNTAVERDWALNALRFGRVSILVTTGVAATALAADSARFVVNYDCPSIPDEYPRRLKHMACADGTGRMYTFLAPNEAQHAKELITSLRGAGHVIPPQLVKVAKNVQRW